MDRTRGGLYALIRYALVFRLLISLSCLLLPVNSQPEEVVSSDSSYSFESAAASQDGQETSSHRRLFADRGEDDAPTTPLIIVLGLPRSGSEALHEFFQCNGLRSAHYCCDDASNTGKSHFFCGRNVPTCGSCVHDNMLHGRPPFSECGRRRQGAAANNERIENTTSSPLEQNGVLGGADNGAYYYNVYSRFDVETSDPYAWFLPQHFALPLLYEAYPDAIWILNTRSTPTRWADSVLHWYSVTRRIFESFGLEYYHNDPKQSNIVLAPKRDMREPELRRALNRSLARAENYTAHQLRWSLLEQVYRNHTVRVQNFFQRHASSNGAGAVRNRLIHVQVDDPHAGTVLSSALTGLSSDCWKFDAAALDEDWKDVSLKL